MAQVSKKGLTLAKLTTWLELSNQGILDAERLASAVKEGLEKGEIVPQTEEVFAAQSAELLAFAKQLQLIKVAKPAFGGVHKKGYESYIKAQHPETVPLIEAMDKLSERSYEIITDSGEILTVQPLPFYRNITPKASDAQADVPETEGSVTV
jgi:hypothetical protein